MIQFPLRWGKVLIHSLTIPRSWSTATQLTGQALALCSPFPHGEEQYRCLGPVLALWPSVTLTFACVHRSGPAHERMMKRLGGGVRALCRLARHSHPSELSFKLLSSFLTLTFVLTLSLHLSPSFSSCPSFAFRRSSGRSQVQGLRCPACCSAPPSGRTNTLIRPTSHTTN